MTQLTQNRQTQKHSTRPQNPNNVHAARRTSAAPARGRASPSTCRCLRDAEAARTELSPTASWCRRSRRTSHRCGSVALCDLRGRVYDMMGRRRRRGRTELERVEGSSWPSACGDTIRQGVVLRAVGEGEGEGVKQRMVSCVDKCLSCHARALVLQPCSSDVTMLAAIRERLEKRGG
eukprot:350758-Chlamydomonas_euryale.AAC.9